MNINRWKRERKKCWKDKERENPTAEREWKDIREKSSSKKDLLENDFYKSATKDNSNEVNYDIKKENEKFGKCAWTAERTY